MQNHWALGQAFNCSDLCCFNATIIAISKAVNTLEVGPDSQVFNPVG
jgi:hypothetical protein